jgi:hypothetical protein
MKWFFKWIWNGIRNAERHEEELKINEAKDRDWVDRYRPGLAIPTGIKLNKVKPGPSVEGIQLSTQAMHLRIYPATGGHIVEYSYYNDATDQNEQALHLIPSDLDLGSELSKILTLQALKR